MRETADEEGSTDGGRSETLELAPEDFYLDGESLVFTEAYHRKRGFCCNSGCRHCPFREP